MLNLQTFCNTDNSKSWNWFNDIIMATHVMWVIIVSYTFSNGQKSKRKCMIFLPGKK